MPATEFAILLETIWRDRMYERQLKSNSRSVIRESVSRFRSYYSCYAAGLLFYGTDYGRAFRIVRPFNQVMLPFAQ